MTVHQNDPYSLERRGRGAENPRAPRGVGRKGEVRREGKDASPRRDAFRRDPPAHQLHQPPGDGQPQAGAAVTPGDRVVRLSEWVEQGRQPLRLDPDPGVPDRKPEPDPLVGALIRRHLDNDLSGLGELDRIAGEVDQDLAQPERVSHQAAGNLGIGGDYQIQGLLSRPASEHIRKIFQDIEQVKGVGRKVELPGLDLGEVEDIVDDPQKDPGRVPDLVQVIPLTAGQVGLEGEVGEPHDGIHGGPDFVAHVGQKLAFGPSRRFGRLTGPLGLGFLPGLGDLREQAVVVEEPTGVVPDRLSGNGHPDDLPLPAAEPNLVTVDPSPLTEPPPHRTTVHPVDEELTPEIGHRPAQGLGAGVAQNPGHGWVGADDPSRR